MKKAVGITLAVLLVACISAPAYAKCWGAIEPNEPVLCAEDDWGKKAAVTFASGFGAGAVTGGPVGAAAGGAGATLPLFLDVKAYYPPEPTIGNPKAPASQGATLGTNSKTAGTSASVSVGSNTTKTGTTANATAGSSTSKNSKITK